MEYILLIVVIVFVLAWSWREREYRLERQDLRREGARERSELLTRITHPELVVVPDTPRTEVSLPDSDAEQDDFALVGSVIPGLPE